VDEINVNRSFQREACTAFRYQRRSYLANPAADKTFFLLSQQRGHESPSCRQHELARSTQQYAADSRTARKVSYVAWQRGSKILPDDIFRRTDLQNVGRYPRAEALHFDEINRGF